MAPLPCCLKGSVQDYVDVARVGKLHLNGSLLTWDVKGCVANDVDSFCSAFQHRMKVMHGNIDDQTVTKMAHWVCKSLSGNYLLAEVITALKELVEVPDDSLITLSSASEDGSVMDYFVDVLPGCKKLRVGLRWPWKGNIVEFRLNSDASKVEQGTLSCIQTEFDCPPAFNYKPVYKLYLNLYETGSSILDPQESHTSGVEMSSIYQLTASEPLREVDSNEVPNTEACLPNADNIEDDDEVSSVSVWDSLDTSIVAACLLNGENAEAIISRPQDLVDRRQGSGCFHRIDCKDKDLLWRRQGTGSFRRADCQEQERHVGRQFLRKCTGWIHNATHKQHRTRA